MPPSQKTIFALSLVALAPVGGLAFQIAHDVAEELVQRTQHHARVLNESARAALRTGAGLLAGAETNLRHASSLDNAYW